MRSRGWVVSAVVSAVVVGALTAGAGARGKKVDPTTRAITALIEAQFRAWDEVSRTKQPPATSAYAPFAVIAMTGSTVTPQVTKFTEMESKWALFGPAAIKRHKLRDLSVGIARDGRSAWVTFDAKVAIDGLYGAATLDLRASQLLYKTETGWTIGSGAWSLGQSARALAKAARAGELDPLEPVSNSNIGDRGVIAALDSFVRSGLDETATRRQDVIVIGPAPRERIVGSKLLQKQLAKAWIGAATLDGAVWAVTAPSGTTATAIANVQLQRGTGEAAYMVPARVFVVFDKDATDTWSVVHAHIAVAPPGER